MFCVGDEIVLGTAFPCQTRVFFDFTRHLFDSGERFDGGGAFYCG